MMRMAAVLLASILISSGISAQSMSGFVEQGTIFSQGEEPSYVLRFSLTKMYSEKLGMFVWAITSPGWNEGTVGVVWQPRSNVQLTLGGGYEQDPNPYRAIASAWIGGKGRFAPSLLIVGEHGGSGSWYRVLGTVQFSRDLRVGTNVERFLGIGHYMSLDIRGTPLQVWAIPFSMDLIEGDRGARTSVGVQLKL